MFLFLKLILAHLVADFTLQFEELYRLKVRSLWGHILHVLIHWMVSLLLLFPYWNKPFIWFFVTGIAALHLVQDFIKYTLTKKIPKNTFFYFLGDQFFHVLAISTILLFPISAEVHGFPAHRWLNIIYLDNTLTLFFIFFILLTFAGNYAFHAFYRNYVKDARPLHWITSLEMAQAILERSVIAAAILFCPQPQWAFFSLAVGLLRLPSSRLRNLRDFLLSAIYAIILSDLFLYLVP